MRKPGNPTGKGGFKKGQSGNPGGRPKELKGIQELARSHAEMAIETLAKIAKDGQSEASRASAANSLLDRGYGRPAQFVSGDTERFRSALEMSDDELATTAAGGGDGVDSPPQRPKQSR